LVRRGAERIAKAVRWAAAKVLEEAADGTADPRDEAKVELAQKQYALTEVERPTAIEEAEARRRALVPAVETVEVVTKYEGHLQRQLVQALHELERRQPLRSDCPPHPPATLDVTLHAPEGTTLPGLATG
jgi:hypothetical protein